MEGHRARRRFSQNFLHDRHYVDRIVAAIDPKPGERLVEIGPGLGALTQPLIERAGGIAAVEIDRDLAQRLRLRFPPPLLALIEGDALELDWTGLAAADARPMRIVGNLPYHISTPLLFALLTVASRVRDQHFMLQKEVVDRMAAAPGGKDYGRLTVMLQWRYRIEPVLEVPPEAFEPPPRVRSAVVRMQPLPVPADVDAARLGALVTVAFSQRRKLLRHTLGRWIEAEGLTLPFDLQRRAEEVPVTEYLALARAPRG